LVNESIPEGFNISLLGILVAFTTISLRFMVTFAQTLLKEGGDVISYSLEFLITLCLCSLETTGYMAPNKWHGHSVRSGPMVHCCNGLLSLERNGGQDGIWGEDEGTWRLPAVVLTGI
jgi:hypothetical protein